MENISCILDLLHKLIYFDRNAYILTFPVAITTWIPLDIASLKALAFAEET